MIADAEEKKVNAREELLDVAERLFTDKGYAAVGSR